MSKKSASGILICCSSWKWRQ